MGTKWAINLFLPVTLSDEEMRDIPMPRLELHIHVMYKTVQAGTILGMGIFGPLIALIRRRPFAATCLRAGQIGALIGVPAGPMMTEMTLSKTKSTDDMVWDRCYRLRYNRSQVRVDRACTYGELAGAAFAMTSGGSLLNGSLTGLALATVAAGVFNNSGMVTEESIVRPDKVKAKEEAQEEEAQGSKA